MWKKKVLDLDNDQIYFFWPAISCYLLKHNLCHTYAVRIVPKVHSNHIWARFLGVGNSRDFRSVWGLFFSSRAYHLIHIYQLFLQELAMITYLISTIPTFLFLSNIFLQEFGDSARARKLYIDDESEEEEELEPNPKLGAGLSITMTMRMMTTIPILMILTRIKPNGTRRPFFCQITLKCLPSNE